MNRIPIATISDGSRKIEVFYPDYYDDIISGKEEGIPYPLPEYGINGDSKLKDDFISFFEFNDKITVGCHPPYGLICTAVSLFAKENNYHYTDDFPNEEVEQLEREYNPKAIY